MTADEAQAALQRAWDASQQLGNGITQISEDVISGQPEQQAMKDGVIELTADLD